MIEGKLSRLQSALLQAGPELTERSSSLWHQTVRLATTSQVLKLIWDSDLNLPPRAWWVLCGSASSGESRQETRSFCGTPTDVFREEIDVVVVVVVVIVVVVVVRSCVLRELSRILVRVAKEFLIPNSLELTIRKNVPRRSFSYC